MKITEEFIPFIEKALGIELYDWQKQYILGKEGMRYGGRATGRTTAYCICLALTDGEPLNMDTPWDFADEPSLTWRKTYAKSFFRHEFMDIREKLKNHGFKVRDIKNFRK